MKKKGEFYIIIIIIISDRRALRDKKRMQVKQIMFQRQLISSNPTLSRIQLLLVQW